MSRRRYGQRRPALLWGLLTAMAACAAPSEPPFEIASHRYETGRHLSLPKSLREISGLAVDDRGHAYAHNDERGTIHQIDYRNVERVSRFSLEGDVKADFEGIAVLGKRLFLVTSEGILFETWIGEPDATVPFIRHESGLDCEVEGLTVTQDDRALLVACKNLPKGASGIVVHRWDLDTAAYRASPALSVPLARVSEFLADRYPEARPVTKVQPTGITLSAEGHLVLVAARQHLLLEFTPEGTPVAAAWLDPRIHRQAEGIAITSDGWLLVASEGDSKGDKKSPGVLSVYEPID